MCTFHVASVCLLLHEYAYACFWSSALQTVDEKSTSISEMSNNEKRVLHVKLLSFLLVRNFSSILCLIADQFCVDNLKEVSLSAGSISLLFVLSVTSSPTWSEAR